MWKANGRTTTDAYPWQKLTWPKARWAKKWVYKGVRNGRKFVFLYSKQVTYWYIVLQYKYFLEIKNTKRYRNINGTFFDKSILDKDFPSSIDDLSQFWLFCLSPLVFLLAKTIKLFGFQVFWVWAYLMKVIQEMHWAH